MVLTRRLAQRLRIGPAKIIFRAVSRPVSIHERYSGGGTLRKRASVSGDRSAPALQAHQGLGRIRERWQRLTSARSGRWRVLRCLQKLPEDLKQPCERNAPQGCAKPWNPCDINRRIGEAGREEQLGTKRRPSVSLACKLRHQHECREDGEAFQQIAVRALCATSPIPRKPADFRGCRRAAKTQSARSRPRGR
jgi:hypothetical protein